ncbi:deoxycytidine triphosphate deaminase [Actinomycetospora cinnamomea]|uniref:Deoxycytidine triphosphate deaminase n=1 Tax=Actinomycetospora cinnamomea TaxID=663609 RepID=A0A2U1FG11_9PSEU|nr:deoxycytidine triphosphate deaminase [Actinomycetospora cinnamomea]
MLLSDRDIRAEIAAGRVGLDPFDATLLQPSSVDLRLDRHFRTFNNHAYTHIDPALQQDELTRPVEPPGPDEAFVLHPGEFVLGSTYEVISLPDDIAGRLEGKALAVDTPVPTPTGWTTMGDVRVGDEVFGLDGRPVRVIATTEVMLGRPCYDVRFSDGEVVTADAAHRWRTTTKPARKRQHPATVSTTEEIAASLRWHDEVNHHVELANAVHCPEADLPIDPYVLGVWLGDGTSSTAEVTCGPGDEQMLDEIRAAGHDVGKASGRYAYRVGGLCRGRVGRTRDAGGRYSADGSLSSALRALGVLGNKHIPVAYLRGSIGQRLALLQGLMDSDGYVDVAGRCEFVNMREDLSNGVAELAASLGLRPRQRKKRANFRGVEHGLAHQVKFTPWFEVFRLERKVARLKTPDRRRHLHRGIADVQATGSRPVRCIQVAAADGMFLVGRTFIPTHNSSLGRLGLLTHSTAGFIDPGFSGHVTLELSNVANLPIRLWPGMKVGQLCLFRLSSPAEHPYGSPVYGSRYQDQRGPTPSRSFVNFRRGLSEDGR